MSDRAFDFRIAQLRALRALDELRENAWLRIVARDYKPREFGINAELVHFYDIAIDAIYRQSPPPESEGE